MLREHHTLWFCSAHLRLEAVIKDIINKYTNNAPDDVAVAIALDLLDIFSLVWCCLQEYTV